MDSFKEMWYNVESKISGVDFWVGTSFVFLKIIGIVLGTYLIVKAGKKIIEKSLHFNDNLTDSNRRVTTMIKLVDNIFTYVVYFVSFLLILGEFNFNLAPLLAGAGVLGLAIGFGAQNFVKDVISGFFIVFEDQFGIGDYIRLGKKEGYVEEIGFRVTKIKSWTGEVHIFPNGSIKDVTNYSIHNSIAVIDVNISYEEDIDKVEIIMSDFLKTLPDIHKEMIKAPEVLGVHNLGPSEATIRITSEVTPVSHWKIGRILRKEIKKHLEENNIYIAYPKVITLSK